MSNRNIQEKIPYTIGKYLFLQLFQMVCMSIIKVTGKQHGNLLSKIGIKELFSMYLIFILVVSLFTNMICVCCVKSRKIGKKEKTSQCYPLLQFDRSPFCLSSLQTWIHKWQFLVTSFIHWLANTFPYHCMHSLALLYDDIYSILWYEYTMIYSTSPHSWEVG